MAKRTASAKKQARAGVRRTLRNRAVRSEVKTKIVKARRFWLAVTAFLNSSTRYEPSTAPHPKASSTAGTRRAARLGSRDSW